MTGLAVAANAASLTFEQFVAAIARALEDDQDRFDATTPLMGGVCRDELDLLVVFACCDRWLAGFALPDQLTLAHANLGDVHHYLLAHAAHRVQDCPSPSRPDRRWSR